MIKRVSASDAKNNFGGLLEEVAALGRVDIFKHGRLVAVMLSPRAFESGQGRNVAAAPHTAWGRKHMIAPERARAARVLGVANDFDEE
jgi:prevent-host-death family protein